MIVLVILGLFIIAILEVIIIRSILVYRFRIGLIEDGYNILKGIYIHDGTK